MFTNLRCFRSYNKAAAVGDRGAGLLLARGGGTDSVRRGVLYSEPCEVHGGSRGL